MFHFSIGTLALLAPIAAVALYLLVFLLRCAEAWVRRNDPPRERVGVVCVLLAALGFFVGGVAQGMWDNSATCRATGQAPGVCLFFPPSA